MTLPSIVQHKESECGAQEAASASASGAAVAVMEAPVPPPLGRVSPLATIDEDDLPPEKRHCLQALREGKRCPALS